MSLSASNSRVYRRSPCHTVTMYGGSCNRQTRRSAPARPAVRLLRYCGTRKAPMTDSTSTGDAIFPPSSIRVARAREISPRFSPFLVGRSIRDVTARKNRPLAVARLYSSPLPAFPFSSPCTTDNLVDLIRSWQSSARLPLILIQRQCVTKERHRKLAILGI